MRYQIIKLIEFIEDHLLWFLISLMVICLILISFVGFDENAFWIGFGAGGGFR